MKKILLNLIVKLYKKVYKEDVFFFETLKSKAKELNKLESTEYFSVGVTYSQYREGKGKYEFSIYTPIKFHHTSAKSYPSLLEKIDLILQKPDTDKKTILI